MKLLFLTLLSIMTFSQVTDTPIHGKFLEHYSPEELTQLKAMSAEDIAVMNWSVSNALSKPFQPKGKAVTVVTSFSSEEIFNASTYLDLGLRIKDTETQYIGIENSQQVMSLTSFQRLKVMYKSQNK